MLKPQQKPFPILIIHNFCEILDMEAKVAGKRTTQGMQHSQDGSMLALIPQAKLRILNHIHKIKKKTSPYLLALNESRVIKII